MKNKRAKYTGIVIDDIGDGEYRARLDNVEVELSWLGEGWDGDYNDKDPDDRPLMRFDVSLILENGSRLAIDDASYCTQIYFTDSDEIKILALEHITREYARALASATGDYIPSVKKLGENLSWIGPHWFEDDSITLKSYAIRESVTLRGHNNEIDTRTM